MNKKYVTFEPILAGFNNVWINLEMMLALASVTNRTILLGDVLTYGAYTHFYNDLGKIYHESIWEVLDKTEIQKNYDVEFIEEKHLHQNHPEYKQRIFPNVCNINIPPSWYRFPYDSDGLTPCVVNTKKVIDYDDYNNFLCNRRFVDISEVDNKEIISIDVFGQFFYNMYLGSKEQRINIKRKINNSLVYKQSYLDAAENILKPNTYNAIHIRYSKLIGEDFGDEYDFNPNGNPHLLLESIEKLFEKDVPLYIATDLTRHGAIHNGELRHNITFDSYIEPIRNKYTVITLEDLNLDLSPNETIAMDQLLSVNAKTFYGSYYSTFSKRIDVLRGIAGKTTHDYMGWNKIQQSYVQVDSPYPWKHLSKPIWPWYYSSYPQYMQEI